MNRNSFFESLEDSNDKRGTRFEVLFLKSIFKCKTLAYHPLYIIFIYKHIIYPISLIRSSFLDM